MNKIYFSSGVLAVIFCVTLHAGSGFSTMKGAASSKSKQGVEAGKNNAAASVKPSQNLAPEEDTYVSLLPDDISQLPGVLPLADSVMQKSDGDSVSMLMTSDGRTLSILSLQRYLKQFPLFKTEILQQGPCKHDWVSLSVLLVCMRILSDLEVDSKVNYKYFLEANILLILCDAFSYNPQINPNEIWPRCKELLNVCGIDSNKNSRDVMLNLEHSIFSCLKFLLSQNK